MKYVFILNRFSLKDKLDSLVKKIETVAKKKKLDYMIEINSEKESTEAIIKKYKKKKCILMAVGGDGTINRVLNELVGTKCVLGFIPNGTGNDFYKTCQETLKPGIHKIDLIKINKKYFINVACFGIDAEIGNSDEVIHSKWIPEKQRYNMGILKHFLKYKARNMTVQVGKEKEEGLATTVVVCNGRYYGGGYKVGYQSNMQDHMLEVYFIHKMKKLDMAVLMKGMNKGKHETSPYTKKWMTKKVKITSPKQIECNLDGEKLTSNQFDIQLIPEGVNIYYDQELIDSII